MLHWLRRLFGNRDASHASVSGSEATVHAGRATDSYFSNLAVCSMLFQKRTLNALVFLRAKAYDTSPDSSVKLVTLTAFLISGPFLHWNKADEF